MDKSDIVFIITSLAFLTFIICSNLYDFFIKKKANNIRLDKLEREVFKLEYHAKLIQYEKELVGRLLEVARDENIPVFPYDNDDPKMTIKGTKCAGLYYYGGLKHIKIAKKYLNMPYILAHELGHHFAIKKHNDHSEDGADIEGCELMFRLLDEDRKKFMSPYIELMRPKVKDASK